MSPAAELVARARDGDGDAFAELYREHLGAVAGVVRRHLSDRAAAADAVQDTFLHAYERLPSLRQPDRFRPWVLAIARNAAIDRRRAAAKAPVADTDCRPEPAAPDAGPSEFVEVAELSDALRRCVGGLSARDAAALAMVTELGFRPAEVAAALGVSVGAARVIVHRARRRLAAAARVA